MSRLTLCNYCTLQGIKQLATNTGGTIVTHPAPIEGLANSENAVDILIQYPDGKEPVWVAWLWLITDRCVC